MSGSVFGDITTRLTAMYLEDARPWLIGFSGGKDSTLVASLVFDAVLAVAPEARTKEIAVLCTDTRVEIPAIAGMIESTLGRMRRYSIEQNLNIEVNLLRPPPEESFWVNLIGRGYPPPNRTFRWCTQRLKIDPVTRFVERRIGRWGEAVLHLGARHDADKCGQMQKDAHGRHRTSDDLDAPREPAQTRPAAIVTSPAGPPGHGRRVTSKVAPVTVRPRI